MTKENEFIGIKLSSQLFQDLRDAKPEWKNVNATTLADMILREKLGDLKRVN